MQDYSFNHPDIDCLDMNHLVWKDNEWDINSTFFLILFFNYEKIHGKLFFVVYYNIGETLLATQYLIFDIGFKLVDVRHEVVSMKLS